MLPIFPLFIILALGLFLYMTIWYVFGFLYLKRIDSVDIAWGLGFIYTALIALYIFGEFQVIPILACCFVGLWGVRLSLHIGIRNSKKPEDARYQAFRDKWKQNLDTKVYVRIFLLQGALILAISSASIGVIAGEEFNLAIAKLGFGVWLLGIAYEAVADYQLRQFLKRKTAKNQIMTSGLWRYSRHPNYFGEITAWSGAGLVACSAGNYWSLIGPLVLAVLIIKVSGIPPIEQRYKANETFQRYKMKTSSLLPLPPKG